MIEFGKTLKDAREAKGLSVAQLSEMTHMAPSKVEELENEDFHSITAPIYGRGFIKLYCEAVGIDPKPLVAEFMDIYTGNRKPAIRERAVEAPPPPEAPIPEETANEAPPAGIPPAEPLAPEPPAAPVIRPAELFSEFEPPPEPPPKRTRVLPTEATPPTPFPPETDETPVRETEDHPLSRYATPLKQIHDTAESAANSSVLRFGLLILAAGALLWGGFVGLRALYRATSAPPPGDSFDQTPAPEVASAVAPEPAPVAKPADPKPAERKPVEKKRKSASKGPTRPTSRTPQKIPSLYVN